MSLAEAVRTRIPERWIRRWPTIRAVLVGYHALAVLLLSFPSPPAGNMQRSAWENPTVQNEFQLWSERLRGAGVNVTAAELDSELYAAAQRFLGVRTKVIAPFEPYATFAGARQNWQLFVAPQRYPIRIEISLREGGSWRTLYTSRSDEFTWRSSLFEHYRMRRVVLFTTWGDDRNFKMLSDWIAAQAARDFPNATDVSIRKLRYRTPTPTEALEGKTAPEAKYVGRELRKLGASK
jgi:hypothetical protein